MVDAAAATDSTVLLRGESGTGKELLARRLHQRAAARGRPLHPRELRGGAPRDLGERVLRPSQGRVHGRHRRPRGPVPARPRRHACSSTRWGPCRAPAQAKLLRAIQDGEFDRLGDEQPTRVDVRIVAATNSDLEADIKAGRFRADLYYRLNVLQIRVPPLRERPEDIPLLAARVRRARSRRAWAGPRPAWGRRRVARLGSYSWPGNVRELRSVDRARAHPAPGPGPRGARPRARSRWPPRPRAPPPRRPRRTT